MKLNEGEYAYDNLSSADFVVGDFPFHEFVQHISGKSSYDMISGIKEFYAALPEGDAPVQSDGRYTEKEFVSVYYRRLVEAGVEKKILKEVFKHDTKTLDSWAGIDTSRKKSPTVGSEQI